MSSPQLNKVKPKRVPWWRDTVAPGHGGEKLRLGLTEAEVRGILGPPSETANFPEYFYYIYSDRGVDVDFGRSGGRVRRLYFFRRGVDNHTFGAQVKVNGIGFDDSEPEVRAAFGSPDHTEPLARFGKRVVRGALTYNRGVQFDFGPDGKLDVIVIFETSVK